MFQAPRSNDLFSFTGVANGSAIDTHNGLNQILTTGASAVTHDARGNMTSDGMRTFGYSSENLLTNSGAWTLAYDPLLRLSQIGDGTTTTRFTHDGANIAAEYDAAGNLLRRHVHAPGIEEPLLTYEGSGTSDRRFLHADERGSIVGQSNFFVQPEEPTDKWTDYSKCAFHLRTYLTRIEAPLPARRRASRRLGADAWWCAGRRADQGPEPSFFPVRAIQPVPGVGLEPTTYRLQGGCSTS